MSERSNVLSNGVNMSAPSAGGSPASRGHYGQNGVTTRLPPPTPGEHEACSRPLCPLALQIGPRRIALTSLQTSSHEPSALDRYCRPSTPGLGLHHAIASPNKYDVIIRRAIANQAHAEGLLAQEIGKRSDAQASVHTSQKAISGLLQDGMALAEGLLQDGMALASNTMSTLRHWEQDRNAGVQFGNYVPLPLSAQPSGNFQIQDDVRSRYVSAATAGRCRIILRCISDAGTRG